MKKIWKSKKNVVYLFNKQTKNKNMTAYIRFELDGKELNSYIVKGKDIIDMVIQVEEIANRLMDMITEEKKEVSKSTLTAKNVFFTN